MKVIFSNRAGIERELGKANNFKQVVDLVEAFLHEKSYKSKYKRYFPDSNKRLCIDVGSHVEFFFVEQENEEEVKYLDEILKGKDWLEE